MQKWICVGLAALAAVVSAPQTRAESLNVTSSPSGANVEINGALVGITPFHADYPGGYFHKTHLVFSARLDHSMILRVSKDGYSTQQVTLTEGPFEWVAVTGKHHGNYFLLKSDHFALKLQPAALTTNETWPGDERVGPIHPRNVSAPLAREGDRAPGAGAVSISSDPTGAEIYVDGKFVGQTPSKILLTSGPHRVELRASEKKNWVRDLEVMKDSELTLHPVLEESP
ncbi:MAG: PEGA domain-containing protein [Candidatus Acidiferrales bacterium]